MGKTVYETGMSDSVRQILIGLNEEDNFHVITSYDTRLEALRAAVDQYLALQETAETEMSSAT